MSRCHLLPAQFDNGESCMNGLSIRYHRRWLGVSLSLVIAVFAQSSFAEDIAFEMTAPSDQPACCEEDDKGCSYGPCGCVPRGTLFQWSYGTSFGGGPDLNEPLVTDRPDFTEASSTVGLRVAQLEFGYTYTYDSEAGTSVASHSVPETLLRYGILANWLELRIGWNYAEERTRTGATSMTVNGAEDLYLGFKIGLTPQEGILPEMALIPQMFVPTGSADLNNGQVLPGVNWLYGWEVNDIISTGGSSQFNRVTDEVTGDNYVEFAQTWTVGYGLTERVGAYTEWFALFPSDADTAKPEHYFNGGFTYLLNNDVQFDVRAGVGLNNAADDYFVGVGGAVRVY